MLSSRRTVNIEQVLFWFHLRLSLSECPKQVDSTPVVCLSKEVNRNASQNCNCSYKRNWPFQIFKTAKRELQTVNVCWIRMISDL